ncbi:hypothetical protein [Photobacterium kishitanii]|uniref:hypothetical protein n=1 Tax=Photobacterium kishitanii TaxID=318456 RepID=UPI000434465C|nr:hypothetical protein [Photobacterium kishitanii]CEO40786.1 hypothetical protein PPBDW_II0117 [Photobacterium kishitanii]
MSSNRKNQNQLATLTKKLSKLQTMSKSTRDGASKARYTAEIAKIEVELSKLQQTAE